MAEEIIMPKLGLTMETGIVGQWYKSEGDQVQKGENLFELETDKISHEVESTSEGILLKIVVEEGDEVNVGSVVAYIGQSIDELDA